MVTVPTLIYCETGSSRYAACAVDEGFQYGVQLPGRAYIPPYFADQNWKQPNREKYMTALAQYRPQMATVLDWEHEDQLDEVLDWAEEAAQYTKNVIIIPKVIGGIKHIPRLINGASVILGYSVPTRFGKTDLHPDAFTGWPVHLLGGTPQKQIRLWWYLANKCDVVSTDGNVINRMAILSRMYWVPGMHDGYRRFWVQLQRRDMQTWIDDEQLWTTQGQLEAFRRSCINIKSAWETSVIEYNNGMGARV